MALDLADYEKKAADLIKVFWGNREKARQKQMEAGVIDQGERAGVTGGKNLDGFASLILDLVHANGLGHASGTIDFSSFFKALASIDYQGPITFESFSSTVVAQGLSNDLAVWRNLWDKGMDLALHANGYIKAMAQGAGLGVTSRPY